MLLTQSTTFTHRYTQIYIYQHTYIHREVEHKYKHTETYRHREKLICTDKHAYEYTYAHTDAQVYTHADKGNTCTYTQSHT